MSTFDKVKDAIINALQCDESLILPETNIAEGLGVDSLAMMELVMELEDTFDIKIANDQVKDIVTVGDVVAMVEGMTA